MIELPDLDGLRYSVVQDPAGELIGSLTEFYLNEATDQPEWIVVVGASGSMFAPLAQAHVDTGQVVLAVGKDVVLGAPQVPADDRLTQEDRALLYDYYSGQLRHAADEADTAGPDGEHEMIRSEEQLHVGTETVVAGHARLRKHVVTEPVSQTVELIHEELWVHREPLTEDAGISTADVPVGDFAEEEHEIILYAQRPVVTKHAVAVEQVSLATETVTETQTITETLRTEHIDDPDIDRVSTDVDTNLGRSRD